MFGSALDGGAIAGPMGAFMVMALAAGITSFVQDYVPRHPLAYHSTNRTRVAAGRSLPRRCSNDLIHPARGCACRWTGRPERCGT